MNQDLPFVLDSEEQPESFFGEMGDMGLGTPPDCCEGWCVRVCGYVARVCPARWLGTGCGAHDSLPHLPSHLPLSHLPLTPLSPPSLLPLLARPDNDLDMDEFPKHPTLDDPELAASPLFRSQPMPSEFEYEGKDDEQ